MRINDPEVLASVNAAFDRYEQALVTNDVDALDGLFWNDPQTIRYGATENLQGYDAIQQFRAARPGKGLARTVVERHVISVGSHAASTAIVFTRDGVARLGRQTQFWARLEEGWRVIAAHVSWMDGPV